MKNKYKFCKCGNKLSKKTYTRCKKCAGKIHSEWMKGKNNPMYGKHPEWMKGEGNPMYGKKHTEESKQKISQTKIKKGVHKGKKNSMFGVHRYGVDCPNWQGGTYINQEYKYIHNPKHPYSRKGGYVLEHRLVMEKKLSRCLNPEEVVHHINGIKDDNRIENLILFKGQREHAIFHHLERNNEI